MKISELMSILNTTEKNILKLNNTFYYKSGNYYRTEWKKYKKQFNISLASISFWIALIIFCNLSFTNKANASFWRALFVIFICGGIINYSIFKFNVFLPIVICTVEETVEDKKEIALLEEMDKIKKAAESQYYCDYNNIEIIKKDEVKRFNEIKKYYQEKFNE